MIPIHYDHEFECFRGFFVIFQKRISLELIFLKKKTCQ